jgi:hypothetical protein
MLNFIQPGELEGTVLDAPSRPLPQMPVGGIPPGPRPTAAEIRRFVPGVPGVTPVQEVNRYPRGIITIGGTVAASGSALAVNSSPTHRIWITIRNRADSTGVLYLAIGQAASNATAVLELVAAGGLLLDYSVPQDDLYIGASAAGAVNWVISYCDTPS